MDTENRRKMITVTIPCYNEEENVVPMSRAVTALFQDELKEYDYEIIFADNCSTDATRPLLRQLCAEDKHIKAIFNARNFGQLRNPMTFGRRIR